MVLSLYKLLLINKISKLADPEIYNYFTIQNTTTEYNSSNEHYLVLHREKWHVISYGTRDPYHFDDSGRNVRSHHMAPSVLRFHTTTLPKKIRQD